MKKIRRNILEYVGKCSSCVVFPPSQTSQFEPSLHEILVRYQSGLDISKYITTQASRASADMQFSNRVGKVDFLTEVPRFINKVAKDEEKHLSENRINDEKNVDEGLQPNVDNQSQENVNQS